MRKDACAASGGIYRPRKPRASPLHQCVRRHYDELEASGHFTRPVEEQVLTRFLDCGDLHRGFARVYCDWVEDNVLAPVPHRQYVFALPKLLRPYFRQHRQYLGRLCQLIAQLLYQGFKAMAPQGQPGFILYVQTFGDLVTFNPHVHALVADGLFYPSGSFRVLPPIPEAALVEGLRHRVLDFLCTEAGLAPKLATRMRNWEHSGFSVHNQIRIKANDAEGRRHLARYMIRTPFALEKMTYDNKTGMVIYRSKLHATLKRNFQLLPAVKWLTLLLAHIPDKYESLVRYYGFYSNRARGQRNAEASTADSANTLHLDETPTDRATRATWARLIQKVYEVDPLECPKCGHTMRVIAVIDDAAVIR